MKKKQLALLLAMAVFTASALSACQPPPHSGVPSQENTSADSETSAKEGESAEVSYKDTLIVAAYGDQDSMDPQTNVNNDKMLRLVYNSLLTHDEGIGIIGDLAESWEASEDNMTWTFHLRQGVKFHNGKELTAADVKASYDRLLNKEDPVRYTDTMDFIDHCEIVDDYTVNLVLSRAYGAVEASLCLHANMIMDADYIEQYGHDIGIDVDTINGTGPYKLLSWDLDEQMTFEANPDYFDGVAETPNLIVQVIPEASARTLAIETGQVDIVDRPQTEDVPRLMETEGLVVDAKPGYGMHGFQFKCSPDSICSDTRIRQAISYALDRHAIIDALYAPIGETCATSPLTEECFGYTDLGVIEQDQEKAKSLMAEAGYPDGFELSLMTYGGYNKGVEMAEIIKAQLAEVGIHAEIESIEGATFSASLNGLTPEEFKWDMFIMGMGSQTLDADEGLRRLYVTDTSGYNTNNYGFYSNAEVDRLLNEAAAEMDQEKRHKLYDEACQILYIDDPVAVFMNNRNGIYVLTDKVEGFVQKAGGGGAYLEKVRVRN